MPVLVIIWYLFREIKLLTGRLGSCTFATPCSWCILDHKGPFSIRNGLFPPFSYNICYPKAPQLFLAYLSCWFLPTWLNISSQNWRSITINCFEVDNSDPVCTQCPRSPPHVLFLNLKIIDQYFKKKLKNPQLFLTCFCIYVGLLIPIN